MKSKMTEEYVSPLTGNFYVAANGKHKIGKVYVSE